MLAPQAIAQLGTTQGSPTDAGKQQVQQPAQQSAQGMQNPRIGQSYVDPNSGETPNPQVLGMEIPLLDPASDTLSYNGAKIDVGNNALVRARFEKYLQQNPDDSTEAKRYRKKLNSILKLTQKSSRSRSEVGSETLVQIGNGLYDMNDYEGDGGQAGTLASAIASALSVQYANRNRDHDSHLGCGYAMLTGSQLMYDHPGELRCLNLGVSGDRITDVYARIKEDIINLKPDYMTFLIGFNDVSHELTMQCGLSTEKF